MAKFTYRCLTHGEFFLNQEKRQKKVECPSCGADSRAIIKAGSIQTIERLDNGLMTKAVERLANIEEIMEERERKHNESQAEMVLNGNPEDQGT